MRSIRWSWVLGLSILAVTCLACGGGGGGDDDGEDPDDPGNPPRVEYIVEAFEDPFDEDVLATSADWGITENGILRNGPTTSRTAHVYSYPEAANVTNSGRGEYVEYTTPLTGTDTVVSAPWPPVSQGRRTQWAFSDTAMGDAGTITAVSWGPAANATVAATYPNVRLRLGYRAPGFPSLGDSLSGNYALAPTVVYDGPYSVQAMADVGNTAGQPQTPHVGGYTQGAGCLGASGTHNTGLFDYTGWYAWPALTTSFDWDPGDPLVAGDSTLLFDASVQAGDFTQRMRGWLAVTYPCSGVLIAGRPKTRVDTTYEADAPDPDDNFSAGIVNPEPSTVDMSFTLTTLVSVGQSLFFEGAFGAFTDYSTPLLTPSTQPAGVIVAVAFQGAQAVETDRRTIDVSEPHTDWVSSIDLCDGMRYIRYRITLTPAPVSLAPARVDSIQIPMTSLLP